MGVSGSRPAPAAGGTEPRWARNDPPPRTMSHWEAATYFFLDAADRIGLDPGIVALLRRPYRELSVEVPRPDGRWPP